ncbi:MAG: N(G),N(G)-dimethylarginine dimethylaminohydrolase [Deltaproteobacteria bacterium]|nr:N(G),N(G)-dimethylarginine dimethylaminohydrolase [Deltaproteobacteria bacterium]
MTRALVRKIPDSFTRALSAVGAASSIDPVLAREQHALYRAALRVDHEIVVEADEECPDCVFVEDTAVIVGSKAIITRPGAVTRRRETPPIADALAPYLDLVQMQEPATLDGGDVMYVNGKFYVARSARTNAEGIEMLRHWFGRDVVIPVGLPSGTLHLKCVVSPIDQQTILLADENLSPHLFPGVEILRVPREETYAANAVARSSHVVCAAEYPRTIDLLDAAGHHPHPVPTTEVRKADGSLTCQSLVWG